MSVGPVRCARDIPEREPRAGRTCSRAVEQPCGCVWRDPKRCGGGVDGERRSGASPRRSGSPRLAVVKCLRSSLAFSSRPKRTCQPAGDPSGGCSRAVLSRIARSSGARTSGIARPGPDSCSSRAGVSENEPPASLSWAASPSASSAAGSCRPKRHRTRVVSPPRVAVSSRKRTLRWIGKTPLRLSNPTSDSTRDWRRSRCRNGAQP